jgi:hypothetical protein
MNSKLVTFGVAAIVGCTAMTLAHLLGYAVAAVALWEMPDFSWALQRVFLLIGVLLAIPLGITFEAGK